MKYATRYIPVALAVLLLTCQASLRAEEGEKKRPARANPESIAAALTGDLALKDEQKTKVTESYDKTVKPVADKLKAAADADAKKAIYGDMMKAREEFKTALKGILTDDQFKKIEPMFAPREKKNN